VVLEFLTDRSPRVLVEALAAALALLDPSLPDGRAVEPLAAALRDARPTPEERASIATLLGRTGAPRAAPLLVELTRAKDLALRVAAIDALGALGPTSGPGASKQEDATSALLGALVAPDAAVRLHAATALSDSGGAQARDALVTSLDGGDEIDRTAVLTALGGILARAPSDASIAKLVAAFALSAGPERDAIIEAIGRATLPSATTALANMARSEEAADRRAVATVVAARPNDAGLARALLADPDASVRAQAAWALGSLGDASDVPHLDAMAQGVDIDAATNAAAAIARIAARARRPDLAGPLCRLASDPRAFVRTNSLAGLANVGGGCPDDAPERSALENDPAEDVRAAAAVALARHPTPASAQALDRCARTDPSSLVASRCRAGVTATVPARTHAALVYVVPDGSDTPKPLASYAMLFADGTLRTGTTDRRGAVFEPLAPEGDVALRRPSR
jgi:HEAT repeat protein